MRKGLVKLRYYFKKMLFALVSTNFVGKMKVDSI